MADGTSVVSDRWGTSAGPRALRERSQYASRLRLPAAAENRRNCSQVSPCAGRLPSGRGPNADRPFDEPTTSTARRVAAATWMMSSTTVASRAYAVVPARRSRWSRGGASRPSSAPAAGSARHRADASRRDRAARSPDPQPASCRRSFRRGFRARAAPSTRHRWCPRPDQQPLSGCVGRDVLAGACVLGIPEEVEHGIRRKWNSDSGGSGTANPGSGTRNPEEVEHRFRRKWNSGSGGRERSSVA